MVGRERLKQIGNRIYYLPHNLKTDRPVLGYLLGEYDSLMIDLGNSPAHQMEMEQQLKNTGLPLPQRAVITHWHWDHCFGAVGFSGKVMASAATQEQLLRMSGWEWSEQAMQRRIADGEDIPFCCDKIREEYSSLSEIRVKTADQILQHGQVIALGGISCHCFSVVNSHSDDAMIYWIPEERVAFFGDCCCEDYHHGEPHYDCEKLQQLICFLEDLEVDWILEGHRKLESKESLLRELKWELKKKK